MGQTTAVENLHLTYNPHNQFQMQIAFFPLDLMMEVVFPIFLLRGELHVGSTDPTGCTNRVLSCTCCCFVADKRDGSLVLDRRKDLLAYSRTPDPAV